MEGRFIAVCAIHKKEDCMTCGGVQGVNQWKERLEKGDYQWLIRDLSTFPNNQIKAIQLAMVVRQAELSILDKVMEEIHEMKADPLDEEHEGDAAVWNEAIDDALSIIAHAKEH